MEFIYTGYAYQHSSTVLPKGPVWCNTDSLFIRGWPLRLGCGRVAYLQREVGTFGEETFGYSCTPG